MAAVHARVRGAASVVPMVLSMGRVAARGRGAVLRRRGDLRVLLLRARGRAERDLGRRGCLRRGLVLRRGGDGERGRDGAVGCLWGARSAAGCGSATGSGGSPTAFVACRRGTPVVVWLVVAVFFGRPLGWSGDGESAWKIRGGACARHGHARHGCAYGHGGGHVSWRGVQACLDEVFALGLGDEGLQLGGGEGVDEAGLGDDEQEHLGAGEGGEFVCLWGGIR